MASIFLNGKARRSEVVMKTQMNPTIACKVISKVPIFLVLLFSWKKQRQQYGITQTQTTIRATVVLLALEFKFLKLKFTRTSFEDIISLIKFCLIEVYDRGSNPFSSLSPGAVSHSRLKEIVGLAQKLSIVLFLDSCISSVIPSEFFKISITPEFCYSWYSEI